MNQKFVREEFDLYVWEGTSDIAARAERCLAGMDVTLVRADAGTAFPPPRDPGRPAVALVSVSVMGDNRFSGYDWLAVQALPIIWVASEARGRDPRYYPPEYSYTLPLAFTTADLRKLLFELLGVLGQARPRPARAAADCRVRADAGPAGGGRDVRGLSQQRAGPWRNRRRQGARGASAARPRGLGRRPFVAVNCGAIPEGLFEAHFSATPGAFTGAVGAHKGYFEQASGGTLFLDEIGDLPLYQQVKLLRVLEQSTVTRLGSANEVPVDFRLVAATNKDLRVLVAQDEFRADLYYRLAVIELRIPSLEQRGAAEGRAVPLLLERMGAGDEPPDWLLERVGATRYEGNVRELSNVAERVAIVRRQFQSWDRARIERIFDQLAEPLRPPAAMGAGGAQCEPPVFTDAERAERARILAALDANGWRRQDTANTLGISRKVLWEKMRKLHLGGGQGETADGMVEAS